MRIMSQPISLSARAVTLLLRPNVGQPSRAVVLVRLAVGGVFFVSGAVKFLFDNQGPGRFAKIGLPAPLAHVVGAIEMICGLMIVLGLMARLASLALAIDMVVALVTTKLPLLFGPGPEPVAAMPKAGLWAFAYQARLDVTMLAGCVFLLIVGAGLWSLDALLSRRRWVGRLMTDPRVGGAPST
jgi:putative oxidoreductase